MKRNAPQRTTIRNHRQPAKAGLALAACMVAGSFVASGAGQCATAPIRLLPQQLSQIHTKGMPSGQRDLLARMPPDFHHFGVASAGKPAEPEALTLELAANTTITKISTTPDFRVLADGTCRAGRPHTSASTCQLVVQFTPRGAGPRLGKLILHTSTGRTVRFGLLGYYYSPVVSFTPSEIVTVPATVSGKVGLINGALNLGIDDGDELYIADSTGGTLEYIDSSGVMTKLASGYTGMWGVAVDLFGQVYFDVPATGKMYEIYDYGPVVQASGSGTASCTASTPCTLSSEALGTPGEMSMDPYNRLFFVDSHAGAAFSTVQPTPANLIFLYDPFPYQQTPAAAMAADANDNLYSLWANGGVCEIVQQTLYEAENNLVSFTKIAGGHTCGFSGDGGKAGGAEIGNQVGQIAFDLAGNLYFSDTANNRVRRVDAVTGIIRTIAGNGHLGRQGVNGPATMAALGKPTGVVVDSQGQVYVLTPQPQTGPTQVVEKTSTTGWLKFSSQAQGTSSAPLILNVANTGNSTLTFNTYTIRGGDHGDFAIDSSTTNCSFTAGNALPAGGSCQIGVVFTPGATGARSATLTLVDNTINAVSKVKLTGTGS